MDTALLGVRINADGTVGSGEVDFGPARDVYGPAGLTVSEDGDLFVGRHAPGSRIAIIELDAETVRPIGEPRLDFPDGSSMVRWVDSNIIWYEAAALHDGVPNRLMLVERDLLTGSERVFEAPGPAPADRVRESWLPLEAPWRYSRRAGRGQVLRRRSEQEEFELFVDLDWPVEGMAVSPDASTIAVLAYMAPRQIYQLLMIDSVSRRVTSVAQTRLKSNPLWTRDSSALAFVDGPCLLVATRDGVVDEVTCAPTPARLPIGRPPVIGRIDQLLWMDINIAHWSPDNSRLVYAVPVPDEERVELWVVDRQTGEHHTVYAGETGYRTMPRGASWSPDGRHIAFSIRRRPVPAIWALRGAVERVAGAR